MNTDIVITQNHIEKLIFTVRNIEVILDYHLAELYYVETKRINEQVKRNIKRFPDSFMFQLIQSEWENLQSQFATTSNNNIQLSQNLRQFKTGQQIRLALTFKSGLIFSRMSNGFSQNSHPQ